MTESDVETGEVRANYPWFKARVRRALSGAGMTYTEREGTWGSVFTASGTWEQWERLRWALGK